MSYYDGDANDPNVVAKIKQNFRVYASPPHVPPFFCMFNPNCKTENVKVYVGAQN